MIENDDIFDALAAPQRRELLVDLLEHEPQHISSLSYPARDIAGAHDTFLREFLAGELEIEGVEKKIIRLHHVDLPKLAGQGFIEWNRGDHSVTRGARFDELTPILDLLLDQRNRGPLPGSISPTQ